MTHPATIFIALGQHRPEMAAPALDRMANHDVIVLEEPPDDGFLPMLENRLVIDEYLLTSDTEYPVFARRMCEGLRRLHAGGKIIRQVEPFLETLLRIHEHFAAGGSPSDLPRDRSTQQVYDAEKHATRALMTFYETVARSGVGNFGAVVEAVKDFARMDARRLVLRDRMRADAISPMASGDSRVYVEAGQMHYPLAVFLKKKKPPAQSVTPFFMISDVTKKTAVPYRLYGPGDRLTLRYAFTPEARGPYLETLAARALIYNKLIVKAEIDGSADDSPHVRDEIRVIRAVEQLSFADCEAVYARIGAMKTDRARHEFFGTGIGPPSIQGP